MVRVNNRLMMCLSRLLHASALRFSLQRVKLHTQILHIIVKREQQLTADPARVDFKNAFSSKKKRIYSISGQKAFLFQFWRYFLTCANQSGLAWWREKSRKTLLTSAVTFCGARILFFWAASKGLKNSICRVSINPRARSLACLSFQRTAERFLCSLSWECMWRETVAALRVLFKHKNNIHLQHRFVS